MWRIGDDLRSRKELDCFLQRRTLKPQSKEISGWAYPPKYHNHHEHEMRGEYDQEVPSRVCRDVLQYARYLEFDAGHFPTRPCGQENNQ